MRAEQRRSPTPNDIILEVRGRAPRRGAKVTMIGISQDGESFELVFDKSQELRCKVAGELRALRSMEREGRSGEELQEHAQSWLYGFEISRIG